MRQSLASARGRGQDEFESHAVLRRARFATLLCKACVCSLRAGGAAAAALSHGRQVPDISSEGRPVALGQWQVDEQLESAAQSVEGLDRAVGRLFWIFQRGNVRHRPKRGIRLPRPCRLGPDGLIVQRDDERGSSATPFLQPIPTCRNSQRRPHPRARQRAKRSRMNFAGDVPWRAARQRRITVAAYMFETCMCKNASKRVALRNKNNPDLVSCRHIESSLAIRRGSSNPAGNSL